MDELFLKFVNNTLTKREYKKLMDFIKNPEYQGDVKRMMDKYWGDLSVGEKEFRKKEEGEGKVLYKRIIHNIEMREGRQAETSLPKKIRASNFYKIAAVLVTIVGLLYGYQNVVINGDKNTSRNYISDEIEDITLTMDDGKVRVISETEKSNIIGSKGKFIGSQKGSQLNYRNTEITEELLYHVLSVPYGKKFDLLLSDGSQVKLNSGSSIKYPIRFIKGKERKVFLSGEAFFDVATDREHPFIVNSNDINVEVLGTQFNMSYYPEDDDISTVLVEGSVKLYNTDQGSTNQDQTLLTPGELAAWDKTTHKILVKKVDTEIYTAWKDGLLFFKNASFRNIRMKLERHFNVSIDNKYPFLENQVYTASFTNENLEEILEAFKEDTPFKFEYNPNGNKIIITNQTTNSLKPKSK